MTAIERFLTPPQLAKRYGVEPAKVLRWIRAGELRAVDVSEKPGVGQPRFRIDPADVIVFERKRSCYPTPKPVRRRRKATDIVEYVRRKGGER